MLRWPWSKEQTRHASEQGRGWQVTQASRTRRAIALLTGIAAAADYHMDSMSLARLRELCRMHDRRSAIFSGMMDRAVDNIFGHAFDFLPQTGDTNLNKLVKGYIQKKMQPLNCDVTGEMSFDEMNHLALRAVWNDGSVLGVKMATGHLMMFEADQIETPPDKQAGVTLGVEKNSMGRPTALYIRQRPSAGDSGYIPTAEISYQRISRNNCIWPAFRKRFGQTLGLPVIAAALNSYGRFDNYLDFESLAAEGNAMQGLKIKKDPTDQDIPGNVDNPDSQTSSTFEKLQKMEPFSIWELLPGEDVEMVTADRPGNQFSSYTIMMMRIVGVAIGYPLELILLDSSQGNFSNYRGAMLVAQKNFQRWQLFFEEKWCMPWYRWQVMRGIADGSLPAANNIFNASIQWPGWPYIKPLEDAQANQIETGLLTKSVSECIREKGKEPYEVFDEIASERAYLKTLGLEIQITGKAARSQTKQPNNPGGQNHAG